jgi:hypothetical protein
MFLWVLFATAFIVGTGWSADPPTLEDRVAAIDAASTEADGLRVVAGHISRKLGIPVDVLQTQRAQTRLGWGDLLIAHHLAHEAGLAVEDVASQFRRAQGWTDIARNHHLDLAKLTREVQQSQDAIEQRSEDRARTGAPPASSPRSGKGGGKGGGRRTGGHFGAPM